MKCLEFIGSDENVIGLQIGCKSSYLSVNKGIPQGTILGPLLVASINEVGVTVRKSTIHLYVDDAILYSLLPSVAKAVQDLNLDFGAVQQKLFDLILLSNPDQTTCMVFCRKVANSDVGTITSLNETLIERLSFPHIPGILAR